MLVLAPNPQYAAAAHVRTHTPPKLETYALYRECLRQEFRFRCVYCLSTEHEVAPGAKWGGFEVEHYRPKESFKHLQAEYANLLWTCQNCNRAKGKRWPHPTEERVGRRFLDPCRDALAEHMSLEGLVVVPIADSAAGKHMIEEINLNSAVHRLRRQRRVDAARRVALLQAVIDKYKQLPSASHDYMAEIAKAEVALAEHAADLGMVAAEPAVEDCRCPQTSDAPAAVGPPP